MRRWPLLLIATAVFAEPDQVQSDLKRLEHARARIKQPGAHAAVYEAVDRLVKGADARAVSPLADLLVETYALEDTIEVQQRDLELEGAGAKEEIGVIRRELDFLRKKALAGDRSAARKIEEREERIRERDRMFDRVSDRVARLERLRRFAKDLRKRVATGLGAICAAQEDKAADAAFRDLRRVLDVADDAQSLELVGVLKESGRVEAIPHLEAISKHPKASPSTLRQVIFALGRHKTSAALKAILEIATRAEAVRPAALNTLSMIATKRFTELDAARKWVEAN